MPMSRRTVRTDVPSLVASSSAVRVAPIPKIDSSLSVRAEVAAMPHPLTESGHSVATIAVMVIGMTASQIPQEDRRAPAAASVPISGAGASAALLVVLFGSFMDLLDATIVTVAAPAVARTWGPATPRSSG
ncbi:hypothetical protein SVIOM74S_00976 [Streptomyces violarus]